MQTIDHCPHTKARCAVLVLHSCRCVVVAFWFVSMFSQVPYVYFEKRFSKHCTLTANPGRYSDTQYCTKGRYSKLRQVRYSTVASVLSRRPVYFYQREQYCTQYCTNGTAPVCAKGPLELDASRAESELRAANIRTVLCCIAAKGTVLSTTVYGMVPLVQYTVPSVRYPCSKGSFGDYTTVQYCFVGPTSSSLP